MREEHHTDSADTTKIREYYKTYVNKFNTIDEIETFLKRDKQPKLTQKETDNLNSTTSNKETEFAVKNFSTKKTTGPDGFTGECYQILPAN